MSEEFGSRHVPVDIKVKKAEKRLEIAFDDGALFSLPAELLRVESPSAEVQGHGPGQKQLVAGRQHVAIIGAEPVGNYAIKLVFDDLHDTGIYTWDFLYWLGQNQDRVWADYLEALQAAGKHRDPALNPPEPKAHSCGGGHGGCG
ncbi:MAG TPA: DUF971 domain-containing protein [Magnetospirillum sp.]|nr:DUF971 domain-containing protein [Magnetospirillum sp.]